MRVELQCKRCNASQTIVDEPRNLVALACSSCGAQADPRAAEDFASALEDALCELWRLGQNFTVRVEIGTASLPKAFKPSSAEGR